MSPISTWAADKAPRVTVTAVEGKPVIGKVDMLTRAESERMLLFEVHMERGARSTPHRHECDTTGYVLTGEVRAVVAGVSSLLRAGDTFVHPQGVEHSVEAISDARWIEIKSPPIRPF